MLLIEDSAATCELIEQAFRQQGRAGLLKTQPGVAPALRFLNHQAEAQEADMPAAILLDLKLAGEHGLEFLRRLRADPRLSRLPVIILTTSDDPRDIDASYRCGANGYVVKPGTYEALTALVDALCRYWLSWNRCAYTEASDKECST